jgi:hypothetical protein
LPTEDASSAGSGAAAPGCGRRDWFGGDQSSAQIGARGGNLGLLDGSVSWRNIGQMRIYQGSLGWGDTGCIAMW